MIFIFPLGIRAWVDKSMFYTNKFEVDAMREVRAGTVCFYANKKRMESETYMLITHASAMNGDIYEYDILKGPDENTYIVCFDKENGKFIGSGLNNNQEIPILIQMFDYEIIGNPLETPELINLDEVKHSKEEIESLLMQAVQPIDYSKDLLVIADESEIDFGETEEEAEQDMIEESKKAIDVSLAVDEGAKIVPTLNGDITDAYVDWVYGLLDSERQRNNTPMYIIEDNTIIIYVESDFKSSKNLGAYAFKIEWDGYEISDAGQTKNIESSQASELNAVVKALCTIRTPSQIKVFSSSKYVISPFEKGWIYQWEKNDWTKGQNKDKVKNSKLFSKLLKLTQVHRVEFDLVKEVAKNKHLRDCKEKAQGALLGTV